jgi:NADH-quinone oxidoreductase subunit L
LFSLAPEVQFAVAVIGALTLLLAGFSALVQSDI